MKKNSQISRIWNCLIKTGQVNSFDCIDNKMDGRGRILRLGGYIGKLREEKGRDHILTDDEFNGDNGKNCIYKLNPKIYHRVSINNGLLTYWEKI